MVRLQDAKADDDERVERASRFPPLNTPARGARLELSSSADARSGQIYVERSLLLRPSRLDREVIQRERAEATCYRILPLKRNIRPSETSPPSA